MNSDTIVDDMARIIIKRDIGTVLIITFWASSFTVADDVTAVRESEKLKAIQTILHRQNMATPTYLLGIIPDTQIEYCRDFLEDLKTGTDIEVIEPLVRTDNPRDERLAPYQTNCATAKKQKKNANYRDLSSIGNHAFRLYKLELEGKPTDILYGEGARAFYGNGAYQFVDLNACTSVVVSGCCRTTLTPDENDVTVRDIDLIIRYQKSPYVLQVTGIKSDADSDFHYGAVLWGPLPDPVLLQCEFTSRF